jgi:hypothetical protein
LQEVLGKVREEPALHHDLLAHRPAADLLSRQESGRYCSPQLLCCLVPLPAQRVYTKPVLHAFANRIAGLIRARPGGPTTVDGFPLQLEAAHCDQGRGPCLSLSCNIFASCRQKCQPLLQGGPDDVEGRPAWWQRQNSPHNREVAADVPEQGFRPIGSRLRLELLGPLRLKSSLIPGVLRCLRALARLPFHPTICHHESAQLLQVCQVAVLLRDCRRHRQQSRWAGRFRPLRGRFARP